MQIVYSYWYLLLLEELWWKGWTEQSSDKMRCTDPYDIPTIAQTSWIVRLRSATIACRTFAMFSGVLLVDGRPERSPSSTYVRPSLKRLYHKKVLLWLRSLTKCFHKHAVGFYSSFFKLKAKFDADSLLLKICQWCRLKKSPNHYNTTLQKSTKLKNAASRLHGCWHTNSQRVLLTPSSGGRPYHKRFARGIQISRTFG
jgi:hypothetical protein